MAFDFAVTDDVLIQWLTISANDAQKFAKVTEEILRRIDLRHGARTGEDVALIERLSQLTNQMAETDSDLLDENCEQLKEEHRKLAGKLHPDRRSAARSLPPSGVIRYVRWQFICSQRAAAERRPTGV